MLSWTNNRFNPANLNAMPLDWVFLFLLKTDQLLHLLVVVRRRFCALQLLSQLRGNPPATIFFFFFFVADFSAFIKTFDPKPSWECNASVLPSYFHALRAAVYPARSSTLKLTAISTLECFLLDFADTCFLPRTTIYRERLRRNNGKTRKNINNLPIEKILQTILSSRGRTVTRRKNLLESNRGSLGYDYTSPLLNAAVPSSLLY